ncbi:MAG: serine/threonine protein kinase [Planctomycetaceae bacterium]|nr:serine/threonine protein kinase [Planctomycetaceae bacterium]
MGLLDQFKSLLEGKLSISQRYELLREAVSGTMSSFHMAKDKKTGKVVGLKVLDPEKTEFFEARFKGLEKPSEGEIAIQISHPYIVKTIDYGVTNSGEHYVLMEYLDGPGLNVLIKERSPLLDGNRLNLIKQMAQSIGVVHQAGFIHRDICPRNFICANDATELKLIDFGLSVPATKVFMQPGNRTGTPNYMAPEVVRRRPTDQRVDIFSLGVTAYQLCALELPWPSQDVTGKAAMLHDTKAPIDLLEVCPKLNSKLAKVIMECLSVQPSKRPSSTEEFLRAISGVTSAES